MRPYKIEVWGGLFLAIAIGLTGYLINAATKMPILEPLVIALILGIIFRAVLGDKSYLKRGQRTALEIFVPSGIFFYGMKNLNFISISQLSISMIILLLAIILLYFAVILFLGKLLRQKQNITYLTAVGSAICGASAIMMTSSAIDAEAEDISISLFSVVLSALLGAFIILPFLATLFGLSDKLYALLAGAVLQLTGFVKMAAANAFFLAKKLTAQEMLSLALSVKSARYLGLLIALPFFTSRIKKKIVFPLALWLFLGAGILGSYLYQANPLFHKDISATLITPLYNIFWCIAMSAIGLNVDVKVLLSNNGIRAIVMALIGFAASIITFFAGASFIRI